MIQFTRIFDVITHQQKNFVKKDSLAAKVNGKWVYYNTNDVVDNMNQVSMALLGSGYKKGDAISIVGNNRPEWNFVDLGIMQIGAVTVPIYPTISVEDYVYIMNNAEVKLLFVSSQELYDKMVKIKDRIPSLKEIYTFDLIDDPGVHWNEFLKRAAQSDSSQVTAISRTIDQHDIACMIYTSGTTGFPKGVMLSHYNVVENMKSLFDVLPFNETHTALSFLPLNHVFEKIVIYTYFMKGVSVYYAENLDTIGENLREVKPHFFTCVPRLLEKVYERIVNKGLELKGAKRMLFFWALRVGEKWNGQHHQGPWYGLKLSIARKLIFSKWLEALGGNIFAICSGAAPLNIKIGKVFSAAGIRVMEGYGLTETSPVISVNRFNQDENMLGTVGPVVPGVQVKIAADGEILCKGPNVMVGYYKLPDKTAEAIDSDGWFHTGDIGEFVDGKFLKITDRKKELFKTSGGKYVAPQPLENKFKESFFIEQMMVIGDARKFVSALIVPSFANLKSWCEKNGLHFNTNQELISDQRVLDKYKQVVEEKNKEFGHTDQIKKFRLMNEEWTVPGGQLTPTMKLKRKVIIEKYRDMIESMYKD